MIFNIKEKNDAIERYSNANNEYLTLSQNIGKKSEELMNLRRSNSHQTFLQIAGLFDGLQNLPSTFQVSVDQYKSEHESFDKIIQEIENNFHDINMGVDGIGAAEITSGVGVATGVGISVFGPTAAMAIATTFGTASTGAAISSLSGVAATNAALAWLGGGTIAAGGTGIAGGNALLALAGPVGWAIGGTSLISGGILLRRKNKQLLVEANEKANRIQLMNLELKLSIDQIQNLINRMLETLSIIDNLLSILDVNLIVLDYNKLDKTQISLLESLKKSLDILSQLLMSKVNL